MPGRRFRHRYRRTRAESQIGLPLWSLVLFGAVGLLLAFRADVTGPLLYRHMGPLAQLLGPSASAAVSNINALGFALFTGCTIGVYMDFSSRFSIFAQVRTELREALRQIQSPTIRAGLAGLASFKPQRNSADFAPILLEAESDFFSIGTTLPDVLGYTITEEIKKRAERGDNILNIRLLLLNPESAAWIAKEGIQPYIDAHSMARRSGAPLKTLRDMHQQALLNAHEIKAHFNACGYAGTFDVRLYTTIPTISAVFNERRVDLCFYDEVRRGNVLPAWEFTNYPARQTEFSFYRHYKEHFDVIWDRTDTVSIFTPDFKARAALVAAEQRGLQDRSQARQ